MVLYGFESTFHPTKHPCTYQHQAICPLPQGLLQFTVLVLILAVLKVLVLVLKDQWTALVPSLLGTSWYINLKDIATARDKHRWRSLPNNTKATADLESFRSLISTWYSLYIGSSANVKPVKWFIS